MFSMRKYTGAGIFLKCSGQAGFTYVSVLFMIVVMGIALAVAGEVWSTTAKREREAELLFRGEQIMNAIGSYYNRSPGAKMYPERLEELLKDKRGVGTRRHLRRLYVDPMTRKADWDLVKEKSGRIKGVKSASRDEPIKKENFPLRFMDFVDKASYNEWEFVYDPKKQDIGARG